MCMHLENPVVRVRLDPSIEIPVQAMPLHGAEGALPPSLTPSAWEESPCEGGARMDARAGCVRRVPTLFRVAAVASLVVLSPESLNPRLCDVGNGGPNTCLKLSEFLGQQSQHLCL